MLLGSIQPCAKARSAPTVETGQRSPAVNACRKNGKFENGGIVSMPASALIPSRIASKSNCASR